MALGAPLELVADMGRSRRLFRNLTWAGGTSCVLILVVWLWSTRNSAMYMRDDWCINLFSGVLTFRQDAATAAVIAIRNRRASIQSVGNTPSAAPVTGIWSVVPVPRELTSTYGFQGWHFSWGSPWRPIVIPMWTIFLTALAVTTICALRSRWRLRRGYCAECDYCLTGNTSGVCPECGAAIKKFGIEPDRPDPPRV